MFPKERLLIECYMPLELLLSSSHLTDTIIDTNHAAFERHELVIVSRVGLVGRVLRQHVPLGPERTR